MIAAAVLAAACNRRGEYVVTTDLGPAIHALGDDDSDEHDAALARIAALGPDAIPALQRALRTEPAAIRIGVVEALQEVPGPAAAQPLIAAATSDESAQVRQQAIRALGIRGDPPAQSVVEAALRDADPALRLAAAGACPALCRSAPALTRLVELAIAEPSLPNAIAARAAVVRLLADRDPDRRAAARAAVASAIAGAMTAHPTDEQGFRAALLASDIGERSGVERLVAGVGSGTPPLLRLHAIYALGTIGDATAVQALAALDGDAAVSEYAWDALARLATRGVAGAAEARDGWMGARPAGALPPPPGMR